MTTADFAQYSVLIVGDPTCKALAPSVTSNRATWTSAVMATAGGNTVVGNRVVWGSAPVYHRSAHPGADKGISDGIAFAAALAPDTGHATGVYFDASCDASYLRPNSDLVDTLNMLSLGTARPWTEDPRPACGTSVSFVGAAPQFSDITTSDFAGWQLLGAGVVSDIRDRLRTRSQSATDSLVRGDMRHRHHYAGDDVRRGVLPRGRARADVHGRRDLGQPADRDESDQHHAHDHGHGHASAEGPLVGQLVSFTVSGANAGASGTCVPVDCKADSAGKGDVHLHRHQRRDRHDRREHHVQPRDSHRNGREDVGRPDRLRRLRRLRRPLLRRHHPGVRRATSSRSSSGRARTCTSATTDSGPAPWCSGTSRRERRRSRPDGSPRWEAESSSTS